MGEFSQRQKCAVSAGIIEPQGPELVSGKREGECPSNIFSGGVRMADQEVKEKSYVEVGQEVLER
jgi:hypothetical protein